MNIHSFYSDVMDKLDEKVMQHRAKEMQLQSIEDSVKGYEDEIEKLLHDELVHQEALDVLKKINDDRTNEALEQIQNTINWALESIKLEQRFEVILDLKDRGDGKKLSIQLRDIDLDKVRTLKNQTGTAVRQIVSFLAQMTVITIAGASKVVVLDEVLSGLQDTETIRMFGEILVALAENDGFQFFIVEHKSELHEVEKILQYRLKLDSGNALRLIEVKEKESA